MPAATKTKFRQVTVEMRKKNNIVLFIIMAVLLLSPSTVQGDDWYKDEGGYFIVYDENDEELFVAAREIFIGDEYLSEDNKLYRIVKSDMLKNRAWAKFIKDVQLPDVDLEGEDSITAMAQQLNRKVALYASHNSESYVPSDGTQAKEGRGGILDVANTMAQAFKKRGVDAVLDETSHDPHDAGSYRRSRETAVQLIRQHQPGAIFDVHRDAVPAEVYITQINGDNAAKIRLVIGRRNQNRQVNEELAQKIKAVADKKYPGLIKDIFYGRGNYNQELSPRSLLIEVGTYSHTKERAQKSAELFADVVTIAMFGGAAPDRKDTKGQVRVPGMEGESRGAGRGILWTLLIVAGAGAAFLFISNSGRELRSKMRNFSKQEFSSFFGKIKKRKK